MMQSWLKIWINFGFGVARAWKNRREPFPIGATVEFEAYPTAVEGWVLHAFRGRVMDRDLAAALRDPDPGSQYLVPVAVRGDVCFVSPDKLRVVSSELPLRITRPVPG